jgi:hypothetical protein
MTATRCCVFAVVSILIAPTAAIGQQPGQRLSDPDVKKIIEDVEHSRDDFQDHLDSKIKDSTLRGPNGEVRVEDFLKDLKDNVDKLNDRFKKDYSASAEAATVLRQASRIHAHIKAQSGEIKGGSEWDRFAVDLGRLADAYGTTFPLPDGAPVRRINDGEAASTADKIADQVDVVKNAIEHDPGVPKPFRDSVFGDLDQLKDQAKAVKSRASDSKPATAEARQVVALAAKVNDSFKGHTLQPATLSAWGAMRAPLDVLDQAYGGKR